MTIAFLQVPVGSKVPQFFIEFDTSKARQGVAIKNYRALLIGQQVSGATKAADQIDIVTSGSQARQFYGKGSQLFHMANTFIAENQGLNELNCISLLDGASVKAVGAYEILTPPTGAGTLSLMIGGVRYRVPVLATDTGATLIAAMVALIALDLDSHVTVAINVTPEIMDITARNGGEPGNDIDIRENFFVGEELPAGITSTITPMASGSGSVTIAPVITAMAEKQYDIIAMPYSDAANLLLMQTELQDRWGPVRQNDGQLIYCRKESFSSHNAHLGTRNNEQETVMNIAGPTPQYLWASNIAAQVSEEAQRDPARAFTGIALNQVLAPNETEQFIFTERDLTLKAGGSTFGVDAGGTVRMERLRTTRIENEFGALDEALADLNPKLTLSFLRFDFRTLLQLKYQRHKLADDGTRFGPGAAVITPKIGKAEAIARFELWEELALVEGAAQFANDLIVERNAADVNRLDFLLSPDLINQFRVAGVQIGFLL